MVEHVIRTVDRNVSFKAVTASRGKIARAEPVCALYEQNRVRHVSSFVDLEDQFAAMTSDGYVGTGSPDRADAAIWALSELMVAPEPEITISIWSGTMPWAMRDEEITDPQENYELAEEAAAAGELRGSQLTWLLGERRRRGVRA
jgi:hypothetical protein